MAEVVWTVNLELLGTPRVSRARSGSKHLERRTAALLAYLALEGPCARWKLAGLLWPESSEATARSNLRQLLHRLREAAGGECVEGGDPLLLREGISVDVLLLKEAFSAKDHAKVAACSGELLSGAIYDVRTGRLHEVVRSDARHAVGG